MNLQLEEKYLKLAGVDIKSVSDKTINCKCPVCNEGKSKWKHRGYVLKKPKDDTAAYFCQNECGAMSFADMLSHISSSLSSAYLQEAKKQKLKNFRKGSLDVFDLEPSKPTELPIPKLIVIDSQIYDLDELNETSKNYLLEQRKLLYNTLKHFRYIKDLDAIVALFLTPENNIYGYQLRYLEEKRFHIHLFDNNPKIWNLYSIDKTKPVYVFESIFDALSSGLDNVIATLGASLSMETIKMYLDDVELVFCLDNDETGKEKSIKYTSLGFSALVHDKMFPCKDFNEALIGGASVEQVRNYILKNVFSPKLANMKLRLN